MVPTCVALGLKSPSNSAPRFEVSFSSPAWAAAYAMLWSRSVACDFWSAISAANIPAMRPLASISTSSAVMMAMPDSLDFTDGLIVCLVSGDSGGPTGTGPRTPCRAG